VEGRMHGRGIKEYDTGFIYEGMWGNGSRNGTGITYIEEKILSKGIYLNDEFVNGTVLELKIPNGVYSGQFLNSKPHGKGTILYRNGDTYSGAWDLGEKHGFGVLVN
jgi:hypothetical protein